MKLKLNEKTVAALTVPAGKSREYFWDERLAGFGVDVKRSGTKTFVVRRRVGGKIMLRAIGQLGQPRPDGHLWTVALARIEAERMIGELASGKELATREQRNRQANGPTLREAMEIHLEAMAVGGGKGRAANGAKLPCSPRSIATVRAEVGLYLGDWLDRPLLELTGDALRALFPKLRAQARPRVGSVNPPGSALVKRVVAHVGAIWTSADALYELPGRNPAKAVRKWVAEGLLPRETRIEPDAFPGWLERVHRLSPVRRDFHLLALFTAIRSEGLRHLRWEDVDWSARVLHVKRAKGNRPYTIPMTSTVEDILRRRQAENPTIMGDLGGDHGWVLPSWSRARNPETGRFDVIPLSGGQEYDLNRSNGARTKALPGPHALRKTWNSVAMEERVAKEDREALMNHEGLGVNVRHYGFPRSWEGLRVAAEVVERALWQRLKPEPALASVPMSA